MGGSKPGVGGAKGEIWKQLEAESWEWIRLEEVEPIPQVGGAYALFGWAFKEKGPDVVPAGYRGSSEGGA